MRRRACRPLLLYSVAMGAAAIVYFVAGPLAQKLTYYVFGFGSVVAILVGVHVNRPEHRLPWFAFAAGLLLFAAADVVFDLYALGNGAAPVPSVADVLYLAGYPVLAFGVVMLVRVRVPGRDLVSALDGVIAAIGVAVVAWVVVISPYAKNGDVGLATRLVSIAYPTLDLLLVAVGIRLLLAGGSRSLAYALLTASVLVLLVTDGFYTVATMRGTYGDGSLIDTGWLLSYALWGAAALHPSMHMVTTAERARRPRARLALAVLAPAALAPIGLLVLAELDGRSTDVVVISIASAVTLLLVFARIGVLTRALDRSFAAVSRNAEREQVMTKAALAMLTAEDTHAIAGAAARAAVAAAGSAGAWSQFVVAGADGLTIAASAGGDAPVELRADVASSWDRDEDLTRRVRMLDDDGDDDDAVLVAPVSVAMVVRALIVVGGAAVAAPELAPVLGLLASEVALAFQALDSTEERHRSRTERLFAAVMQRSSDVVTLAGPDHVIRSQSPSVEHVLGVANDAYLGRPLGELVHPDDSAAVTVQFDKVLAGGQGAVARVEMRIGHRDGSWRETDTVITNLLGAPDVDAVVLNSRDVTERRALERELHDQALRDPLTSLPNRALFMDRLTHALARGREGATLAVIFADLDDFQVVNDSLGHAAGDRLLEVVAQRLVDSVRPGDTVARLGGDEFAILLEGPDAPSAAEVVAGRVGASLLATVALGGEEVGVRASLGIALGATGEQTAGEVLRNADLAMYRAKQQGKDRWVLYAPAMHEQAVQRLAIAADLQVAIERGELEVFYQPIVELATGLVAGAEGLVRWNHPRRGLLMPDEYIPIAEATGLVVPLDAFVLEDACRQVQEWRTEGRIDDSFYLSLNVSGRQLRDRSVVDDVAHALAASGLPASALVLEVTESAVMGDLDVALACLRELKALGLRLAVDDFGTGYSSLSYINDLPVDLVKIDKSFVDRIEAGDEGVEMVRVVLDLSRVLGLVVVAEGIETDEQLDLLGALGCRNGQGYLFARPMRAADMKRVLEHGRGGRRLHRPAARPSLVLR